MKDEKTDKIKDNLKGRKDELSFSKINSQLKKQRNAFSLFILFLIISQVLLLKELGAVKNDYNLMKTNLEEELTKSKEANEQVLNMLKEIRNEQTRQAAAMQIYYQKKKQKQLEEKTLLKLKAEGINNYTDLGTNINISVEAMDKIINYYAEHTSHGTAFQGKGYVFVEAAKQSGLNPIYLFAHAACESDYGMSYIALDRHNYFGIGAFDSNPNMAYNMGNGVEEGIISGAKWIKENYYNKGLTTLETMNPIYCTDTEWSNTISSIANTALSIL